MSSSMDQIVRIAVLETELKYEKAAKEAAVANSGHILQMFSNVAVSIAEAKAGKNTKSDVTCKAVLEIENVRKQIKSLETEYAQLKAQLQATRRDVCYVSRSTSSAPESSGEGNVVVGELKTPGTGRKYMNLELNSDLCEIDQTDLEALLQSSDDEDDARCTTERDVRSQFIDSILIEGLSMDPIPYDPTTDMSQIERFRSSTIPAPGVLKVGSVSKGVFAGSYNIPSKEEVDLAILADATRTKRNSPSSYSSSRRDKRIINDEYRPMFWTYGISYKAYPTDKSAFRTVHIGNISHGVSLEQILEYVRGGNIISAVLLDTTPINSTMSCLVGFVRVSDASAYVAFVREHPIEISGKQLEVTLVPSATYPVTQSLMNAINHRKTRCLCVRNFPMGIIPLSDVEQDMHLWGPVNIPSMSRIYVDDEKTLQIRCGSIDAANRIFSRWIGHRFYSALKIDYCPDPCAGSLSDLLKQRPGLIQEDDLNRKHHGGGDLKSNIASSIFPRAFQNANPEEISLDSDRECESDCRAHQGSPKSASDDRKLDDKATTPSKESRASSVSSVTLSSSLQDESSWADEMIEEAELEAATIQTLLPVKAVTVFQRSQRHPGENKSDVERSDAVN